MKLYKKVNKAGGITIPQQLRHALNIPKGAALELEDDGDKIIITKHIPTCVCCGKTEDVRVNNGVELCESCARMFLGGEDDGNDNERSS